MYSFVFDTNILINLDNYNPKIFKSLWYNIYSMIENREIFSIKEVEREINKSDDRINQKWQEINSQYDFFKDLSDCPNADKYWNTIQDLEYFEEFQNFGNRSQLWADPYLIAVGKVEDIIVVTDEKMTYNPKRKIPYVCDKLNIKCMSLDDFMIYNRWSW